MAYRFNGSSSFVTFNSAPFNGYSFTAFTIAVLFKRNNVTAGTQGLVVLETSAFGAHYRADVNNSNQQLLAYAGGSDTPAIATVASTTPWYIGVYTFPSGTHGRFHVWDGSSWRHDDGATGAPTNETIAGTDIIRVGVAANVQWFNGDIVCCGIKKTNSTDVAVETLSPTSFAAWRAFGFDWLIGFDSSLVSGGLLQDQASPGTGDQTASSGTSIVSDPPGWLWAPPPVLTRPATNYIAGAGITVAAADNPTLDAVDVTVASTVTGLPTVVNGQWVKGVGGAPVWAAITEADVANLTTDLAAKQSTSAKGAANGYASLDASGLVPAVQLPPLPGAELGYAQITSNVSVGTATEAAAGGLVAAPPITFDGATAVMIEFFSPLVISPAGPSQNIIFYLYQDGTSIGLLGNVTNPATPVVGVPVLLQRRLTPAAGSRNYSIRAGCSGGTGTVVAGAGGVGVYQPMFIRVTRV